MPSREANHELKFALDQSGADHHHNAVSFWKHADIKGADGSHTG
jgi:hypothetical protein